MDLAHASGSYLGVELSAVAVERLNRKFAEEGLSNKARAVAHDFLLLDESQKFDLIFANGVLHHFKDPEALFAKIANLAAPRALLVFHEPSAVRLAYFILRWVYRPFQSDSAWEWPFRPRTVNALQRHFRIVEGFGWGRWSLPLSLLSGLPVVGGLLSKWYVRLVREEMAAGWHSRVWHNSHITACYERR